MNCNELKFHLKALTEAGVEQLSEQNHAATFPQSTEDALRHADTCAACAGLLAEQRELSALLRQLSASDAHCAPPPEREQLLRAAYRSLDWTAAAPAATRNWKPWAGAIAAMLFVTLASIVISSKVPDWLAGAPEPPANGSAGEPAQVAEIPRPIPPLAARPVGSTPVSGAKAPLRTKRRLPKASTAIAVSQPLMTPPADRRDSLATDSPVTADETASDFVPLPYGGDPMLAGSGPVVRVEINGAVLQSLGFLIVGEPSAPLVRADLMLGEDGLARAIRFVP